MTPSISYQVDRVLRGSIPFWLTFFLALLSVVPMRIEGFAIVTPSLVTISVFYWSLHRPNLMSAPVVFVLGLLSDILTGVPMGLSPLILLLVHGISASQRLVFVGRAFIVTWWGFLLVGAGVAFLSWVIACLYSLSILPILPVLMQFVLSMLVFPLCAWCFGLVQNNLLRHI